MAELRSFANNEDYWCFISYRHADNKGQDRDWASWLHREIEQYEVPAELVGKTNERGFVIPKRIYPVFRDEESLPAEANLKSSIANALHRSRFLVVLCSPRAVESRYVAQEIQLFKSSGKDDRIIAAIIDGVPGDPDRQCFPEPLIRGVDSDGNIDPSEEFEPIAADFRKEDGSEGFTTSGAYRRDLLEKGELTKSQVGVVVADYENKLQLMKLKIISGILGLPLETLRNRDEAHQLKMAKRKARVLRGWLVALGVLAVTAIVAGVIAVGQKRIAVEEKKRAFTEVGKGYLRQAEVARERGNGSDSVFYAARALGFEGYGKSPAPNSPLLSALSGDGIRQEFPRLLVESDSPELVSKAVRQISLTAAPPFLWSSRPASAHLSGVRAVACSPDGSLIASGSADGTVGIWDTSTGERLGRLEGHNNQVNAVAWSPDGKLVLSGSKDNSASLWDVTSGEQVASFLKHVESIDCVAFSPDGTRICLGSDDGVASLWDAQSHEFIRWLSGQDRGMSEQDRGINGVAWQPGGEMLVTAARNGSARLWNSKDFKTEDLQVHEHSIWEVSWSPDGRTLAFAVGSGDDGGGVVVWDLAKHERRLVLEEGGRPIYCVAFSPDGRFLASGSTDNSIKVWDAASGALFRNLEGHVDLLTALSWEPSGNFLISGAADGTIRRWDVEAGSELSDHTGHRGAVHCVDWSPDGTLIASGSMDEAVKLWDAATGTLLRTLEGHSFRVHAVTFSPDGKTLVSASAGDEVFLWDIQSGTKLGSFAGHRKHVFGLAFSPDGRFLVSGGGYADGELKVWDVATRTEKYSMGQKIHSRVTGVAVDQGGRWFAASSLDQTVRIFDLETGVLKTTLKGTSNVECVAFGQEGKLVARGCKNGEIVLWSMETQVEVGVLRGHSSAVRSIEFSPDGKTLLSGSGEWGEFSFGPGELKIWNLESKSESTSYNGQAGTVFAVAFGPDGRTFATGSGGGMVKIWSTTPIGGRLSLKAELEGHGSEARSVAWSPDGKTLASGGWNDNTIRLWDVGEAAEVSAIAARWGGIWDVSWSPDGTLITSVGNDRAVEIFDFETGGRRAVMESSAWKTAWSPDGKRLAAGLDRGIVRLWKLETPDKHEDLVGHQGEVKAIGWSPDRRYLASGGQDSTVRIWNATSGELVRTLKGHSREVTRLVWRGDSKRLASGAYDATVKVWDVESGEALATFKGHSKGIPALSWSPDGKRLASGADDKTLVIWNTESGIAEAVIFDHRGDVDCVAWHPDGEMLATSSEDGVVRVYRWLDDRPDLFTYLREGMCEFNADSDLLEWRAPRPNLYDSRSFPFRNVPYGSMLDVLQRCDATTSAGVAQRDWLLYLQFLTADNWASVRLLYERLAVEERKRPHTSVIAACRRLASLVAGQLKSGDEQGALKRLDLALLLSRDLAIRGKEAFYLALGRRFAAERLGEGDVQVVFDRLPDDEARELVKRGFK